MRTRPGRLVGGAKSLQNLAALLAKIFADDPAVTQRLLATLDIGGAGSSEVRKSRTRDLRQVSKLRIY